MSAIFSEIDRSPIGQGAQEYSKTSARYKLFARASKSILLLAIVACAAVSGFFYAYGCSVMYGLNDGSPKLALEAMQGINRTVRNPIFALSFFGTALLLPLVAALAFIANTKRAGVVLVIAAIAYIGGGFVLTMAINVPMNNALAIVDVGTLADPAKAWADYEGPWSFWNWVRTGFSFLALLLATIAFGAMSRRT